MGEKLPKFGEMEILMLDKKKTTTHFNISGIKDIQHWKKVNSQKEKNWKAWFSPKLNAKKLGYYPLCLLEN